MSAICKRYLNDYNGGDSVYIMENISFFHYQLSYLGYMIVPGGLGVQQAKVDALYKIPAPSDVPRLRAFLGLGNYYSLIAKPLTILTEKVQT